MTIREFLLRGVNNYFSFFNGIFDGIELERKRKKLERMKAKAKRRARATGKTHYVLTDSRGELFVACRHEIRVMHKLGIVKGKKNNIGIEKILAASLFIARANNAEVVMNATVRGKRFD